LSDLQNPAAPAFRIDLGAVGLPEQTQMLPGGVYALTAMIPSARFALLAGALRSANKQGLVSTLVVHSKPEQFLSRIESFGNFDPPALHEEHRLHVFVMQEEFQKKVFRFGAERLLKELENYAVPENSFLIFDSAQALLSLHDIAMALGQVDILARWFDKRGVTALLVFTGIGEAQLEAIDALMDSLTGVAKLDAGQNHLQLSFRYWQSQGPVSAAARQYLLSTTDSGLYEAAPWEPVPTIAASNFEPAGFDPSAFGNSNFAPTNMRDSGFADSSFLHAQAGHRPVSPGSRGGAAQPRIPAPARPSAEPAAPTYSYGQQPADRAVRAKPVARAKRSNPVPDDN
jgi:hypothetical protein